MQEAGRRSSRWGLLAGWAVLAAAQVITPLWYPTPDACGYLSIARSLASGAPPTNLGSRNLVFGIGYPLLIAPAFLLGAAPFLAVTAINAALAAAYLAGVVAWAWRREAAAAWPIALLAVGNVIVLALFRRALSEAAFLAALIGFVIVLPTFPGPSAGATCWPPPCSWSPWSWCARPASCSPPGGRCCWRSRCGPGF